jgi:hypothetical protein
VDWDDLNAHLSFARETFSFAEKTVGLHANFVFGDNDMIFPSKRAENTAVIATVISFAYSK